MGTTRRRKATNRRLKKKMKAALFLLSALVASSQAVPKSRNELTCSICIDIITDLDNFITSDTTEDQIVQFFKELCHTLGSLLGASIEQQCNTLMETSCPPSSTASSTTTSTHSRSATPSGCAREHFLMDCRRFRTRA